eukprot:TRINITY_DN2373_c0_g2_i12.p3 TRINITY_DN2373_c0_g2~~TRINITY_DN2373_c0_g2_i12.p3  ORF type:complete len:107 (-),score=31.28 TRINITY_DN2373_c0_g2_i12:150-470(-)
MWIGEVNRLAMANVAKILVGNKADLTAERRVSHEEGEGLAKKYGIKFLESSAKSAFNVLDVFQTMTKEMLEKVNKKVITHTDDRLLKNAKKVTISRSTRGGKGNCC